MERLETQAHQILYDLKKGKYITPIDALNDYGCFRLADRVYVLRNEGWPILKDMVTSPTNNRVRYAKYYLDNDKSKWPE